MSYKSGRGESSYGIVPLQYIGGEWYVLLIQHQKAKYWGFPKGHAENGETPLEAAMRELKEETNLYVSKLLSNSPIQEHYQFLHRTEPVSKTVYFFVAVVDGDLKLQEEEIGNARWIPVREASHHLTYESGRTTLLAASKLCDLYRT